MMLQRSCERPRLAMAVLLAATILGSACDRLQRSQPEENADILRNIEGQLGQVSSRIDTSMTAQLSGAFRSAAAKALPAVVQIAVTQRTPERGDGFPFQGMQEDAGIGLAEGSGFLIAEDGLVLTNNHVIADAVDVRVRLVDGRDFAADVVGGDLDTDVAVIRLRASQPISNLPVADLGRSEDLRVGDWVLALGNPMSLDFTVTAGIVSAKGRSISRAGGTALESFIQTDAAVNPGNSGGPLVDLSGRVVGMNTAISSQTGFFTGASFAIPIDLARKVAADLVQFGEVHRPRLGVGIDDVNSADAAVYKLPAVTGVEVISLEEGQPAERAGMQLGDVIITVAGSKVTSTSDLQSRVATLQPGTDVKIGFIRYGKPLETTVRLGAFEPVARQAVAPPEPARGGNTLGFVARPLPAELAAQVRLDESSPVVVNIDRFGPAAGVGLFPGDVIRRLNGQEIHSLSDLRRASVSLKTGDVVSLIVLRNAARDPSPTIVNYRIH